MTVFVYSLVYFSACANRTFRFVPLPTPSAPRVMASVLCRVCINPFRKSEMTKLLDETSLPSALATILSEIGGIQIPSSADDEVLLPRFCCQSCTGRLVDANELRLLCQESDRKLREKISTSALVKEEFEQNWSDTGEAQTGYSHSHIKTEDIDIGTVSPPSDDEIAHDPDFVEDKPKRKKAAKAKKCSGKRKSTCNRSAPKDISKTERPATEQKQPASKVSFQCSVCGKFLSSKLTLHEHETMHKSLYPHQCHLCPKAYSFHNSLKKHLQSHDPNSVFKCTQCDKVLKSSTTLRYHILTHSGELMFKCKQCPKAYNRKSTLYAHVNSTHYKRKPFKCDHCQKAFTSNYRLKLHQKRAHEGIQLNKCPHCDKHYHSTNYLAQHIAERHPEQLGQLMQCAFCGIGYHSNSHYKKHIGQKHPERMAEYESLIKKD